MYIVTARLLWSKHRLAVEAGKPDLIKEHLRSLVALHEKQLKSEMPRDSQEKAYLQRSLAFERYRLAQASVGINIALLENWELEIPRYSDCCSEIK
jgi:hypothetical protein